MGAGLWDRLQQGAPSRASAAPHTLTKRDERLMRRRMERDQRHANASRSPTNAHTSSANSREQSYLQKRNRRLQQRATPEQRHNPDLHPDLRLTTSMSQRTLVVGENTEKPTSPLHIQHNLNFEKPVVVEKLRSPVQGLDEMSGFPPRNRGIGSSSYPEPAHNSSVQSNPLSPTQEPPTVLQEVQNERVQAGRVSPKAMGKSHGFAPAFPMHAKPFNSENDVNARAEFEAIPSAEERERLQEHGHDKEEVRKRQYREDLERQIAEQKSRKDEIPIKPYLLASTHPVPMHHHRFSKEEEMQIEMAELAASLAGAHMNKPDPQRSSVPSFLNPQATQEGQTLRDKEAQQREYAMALEAQIQERAKAAAAAAQRKPGLSYGQGQTDWSGKPVEADEGREKRLRQQEYARELNNQIHQKQSLAWQSGTSLGQTQGLRIQFQQLPEQRHIPQQQELPMTTIGAEKAARARKVEAQARYRLELLQQQVEKVAIEKQHQSQNQNQNQSQSQSQSRLNPSAYAVEQALASSFPEQVRVPAMEPQTAFAEAPRRSQRMAAVNPDMYPQSSADDGAHARFARSVTNPFTEAESLERKHKQQQQFAELSRQVEQVRKRKAEEKAKREEEERKELERIEEERKAMQEAFEREEKRKKVEQQKKDLQDQIMLKQAQAETQRKKELEEEAKDEARIQRERAEMHQGSHPNLQKLPTPPSFRPSTPVEPATESIPASQSPTAPRQPVTSPSLVKNMEAQKEELDQLRTQALQERKQHQRMREQVEELQSRLDHYEKELSTVPKPQLWEPLEQYPLPISGSELPPQLPLAAKPYSSEIPYQSYHQEDRRRKPRSPQLEDHDQSLVCDSKFVFPDGRTLTDSVYFQDSTRVAPKAKEERSEQERRKTKTIADGNDRKSRRRRRSPYPLPKQIRLATAELDSEDDEAQSSQATTVVSTDEEDSWSIDTNEIHQMNERRYKVLSQVSSSRHANPDQLDLLLKQFDEEQRSTPRRKWLSKRQNGKLGGNTRWLSVSR